jgi:hypothetical protein
MILPRQARDKHRENFKKTVLSQPTFGFCTQEYRAGVFWFEPVDMLRKLLLTGLLQFVHRGSAEQVLVGCTLAFVAFGLTMKLQPYREPEANVLKALVDFQIFLSFLCSFILRVLAAVSTFESLGKAFYGDVLVSSFIVVLVAAGALIAYQVHRHKHALRSSMRESLEGIDSPVSRALRNSLSEIRVGSRAAREVSIN